jgi:ribosome biogenesis protein MAK21
VQHVRSKVLSHAWDLLATKKEQERTLLTFLVNKLGDLDRKIASKTGYLLQQLLTRHPLMKMVVVKEVEVLLFRKGVDARTQYYAAVLLNQIVLSKRVPDVMVARYLIHLYFKMFATLVKNGQYSNDQQGEEQKQVHLNKVHQKHNSGKKQQKQTDALADGGIEAKMMAALMTGMVS